MERGQEEADKSSLQGFVCMWVGASTSQISQYCHGSQLQRAEVGCSGTTSFVLVQGFQPYQLLVCDTKGLRIPRIPTHQKGHSANIKIAIGDQVIQPARSSCGSANMR